MSDRATNAAPKIPMAELDRLATEAGMMSVLLNGAGSFVWSTGCNGVMAEHLGRFAELVAARALAAQAATVEPVADPAQGKRVYLVPTGETHEGKETYTRHDERVPMCDQEVLFSRLRVARARPTQDTFRGDNRQLIDSMRALVELDQKGCLVPHGIGGHARTLLIAGAARLESGLSAPVGQAEDAARWQPIETAPKDGTVVFALWHDESDTVTPRSHGLALWSPRGCWVDARSNGIRLRKPSHWMPLPPPPSAQQAGQAETGEQR